ncbi:hypothetical protein GX645_06505 [Candidatus Sumerlaeota bacterium]|nr:hypothetical protein [Candidatus Sumerlaeota bacterium]
MAGMLPLYRRLLTLYIFLLMCVVGLCSIGAGVIFAFIESQPPLEQLENYDPPEVTRIFDRTGTTQLAEFYSKERRELINIEDVPAHVRNAVLSIEDERFYQHFGVDPQGILRALVSNVTGGRYQGASTITMQVARNLVLETRVRTFSRKIREIFTAIQIERKYSKEQILQFYLNHIFFGANSYGIQAAAHTYFNKDVKDLSVTEGATLAGLPQSPSRLSPFRNIDACRTRRNLVLGNMARLGYIDGGDELKRLQDTPIVLNPAPKSRIYQPYFVDAVRRYMLNRENTGLDSDLFSKGYSVISTVDLSLQRILEEELSKGLRSVERIIEQQKSSRIKRGAIQRGQIRLAKVTDVHADSVDVTLEGRSANIKIKQDLPYFEPERILRKGNYVDVIVQSVSADKLVLTLMGHVQGGAVLLDVKTGEILALAGGDDFYDDANNGQWNRAIQGGRQPGSCWKPLLYAAALDLVDDKGHPRYTPGSTLDDSPLEVNGYRPKNYEGRFYGLTTFSEALVKSRNVPVIRLFLDIGMKLGVSLYQKFNVVTPGGWKLEAVPSLPLGTPDVTPLELAAAYSCFANDGVGITPTPVKRYYSAKNPNDSHVIRPKSTKVLTPQAAYITTSILKDVVARGTAAATVGAWAKSHDKELPEIAGKTGTTNDCLVAWFCGYTPDLVLAVYVGFDQQCSMGNKIVGGGTIGPIWAPMMDRVLQAHGDWTMKFARPAGIQEATICTVSGKLAGSCGHKTAVMPFKAGSAPTEPCSYSAPADEGAGTEEEYQSGWSDGSGGYQQPSRGFFNWF